MCGSSATAMNMGGMMAGMGAWMLLWAVVTVLVLGLAVVGAISIGRALVQRRTPELHGRVQPEGPREILQRRYASGEIDEDEYLRRLSGLD